MGTEKAGYLASMVAVGEEIGMSTNTHELCEGWRIAQVQGHRYWWALERRREGLYAWEILSPFRDSAQDVATWIATNCRRVVPPEAMPAVLALDPGHQRRAEDREGAA